MNTIEIGVTGSAVFSCDEDQPELDASAVRVDFDEDKVEPLVALKASAVLFQSLLEQSQDKIECTTKDQVDIDERRPLIDHSIELLDWINSLDGSIHVNVPDEVKAAALRLQLLALEEISEEL